MLILTNFTEYELKALCLLGTRAEELQERFKKLSRLLTPKGIPAKVRRQCQQCWSWRHCLKPLLMFNFSEIQTPMQLYSRISWRPVKLRTILTSAIDSNDALTESDKLTYLRAAIKGKDAAEIVT